MHTPFKLFSAALLATGLLLSSGLASASAAPAGSGGATPKIIGGSQADDQGIVQLVFTDDAGSHACTGTALSDTWVLTAKHCVETATSMNIYYSNDTKNRGKAVAADSFYQSPKGDVGLVKLAVAHPLSEYHGFSSSYLATVGDQGTIYGYGRREGYVKADHLYQAEVKVSGSGKDQRGGTSIKLKAVTGISWSGDSGGPLFIDGTIVGTSSGGPSDRDINSEVWYAQLSGHSSWIKQTTGL